MKLWVGRSMSKTILKHPLVSEVNLGEPLGIDYKWEVGFIEGYRLQSHDTHWKNVHSVKDWNENYKNSIERCPEDCHCGNGKKGLFYNNEDSVA